MVHMTTAIPHRTHFERLLTRAKVWGRDDRAESIERVPVPTRWRQRGRVAHRLVADDGVRWIAIIDGHRLVTAYEERQRFVRPVKPHRCARDLEAAALEGLRQDSVGLGPAIRDYVASCGGSIFGAARGVILNHGGPDAAGLFAVEVAIEAALAS